MFYVYNLEDFYFKLILIANTLKFLLFCPSITLCLHLQSSLITLGPNFAPNLFSISFFLFSIEQLEGFDSHAFFFFFMLRKDSFYLNLHITSNFLPDQRYVTFKIFNGFKAHINRTKSILSCVLLLEGTDIEVNYLCLTQSPKTFVEKS